MKGTKVLNHRNSVCVYRRACVSVLYLYTHAPSNQSIILVSHTDVVFLVFIQDTSKPHFLAHIHRHFYLILLVNVSSSL